MEKNSFKACTHFLLLVMYENREFLNLRRLNLKAINLINTPNHGMKEPQVKCFVRRGKKTSYETDKNWY